MQNVSTILPVTLAPAAATGDPAPPDGAFALAFDGEKIPETDLDGSGDPTSGCGVGPVLQAPPWAGLAGVDRFDAGSNAPGVSGAAAGELAGNGAGKLVRAEPDLMTLIKPSSGLAVDSDLGRVLTGQSAESGDPADPESAGSGARLSPKDERNAGEPALSDIASTIAHPGPAGLGSDGLRLPPSVQMPGLGEADLSAKTPAKTPETDAFPGGRAVPFPQAVMTGTASEGLDRSGADAVKDGKPVATPQPVGALPLSQIGERSETKDSPADRARPLSDSAQNAALLGPVPNAPSRDTSSNAVRIKAIATATVQDMPPRTPSLNPNGQDPVENSDVPRPAVASARAAAGAQHESGRTASDELAPASWAPVLPEGVPPGSPVTASKSADTPPFGTTIAPALDALRLSATSDLLPGADTEGAETAVTLAAAEARNPKGLLPGVWEQLFNGVMTASPTGQDKPFLAVSPSILPADQSAPGEPSGLKGRDVTPESDPEGQLGHPLEAPRAATSPGATVIARQGAGLAPRSQDLATRPEDAVDPLDDSAMPFLTASGATLPGSVQAISPTQGPAPLPVPHVAAQINAALAQNDDGSTDLALSPEELGKVRLKLKPDAGNPDRMVVMITFERPETLELFRRHAGELADALRSAGYAGADIGFGQENGFASGSDRREGRSGAAPGTPHLDPSDPSPAPARLLVGASLDLRL